MSEKKKAKPKKKGNTGKKGGQLENKNAEKWTEEIAIQIGNDLLAWMRKDTKPPNIFFEEFLHIKNEYHPDLIADLVRKFPSFAELIKSAKKIQEIKLQRYGRGLGAAMAIFSLKNNHGFRDKVDHTTNDKDITSEITVRIIK